MLFNCFKISILALNMHLLINKSTPIFDLFFFDPKPQIEKYLSINELDELILSKNDANLLKLGKFELFLSQKPLVELID